MLTRLHIRNLAVLDEIELELDAGFSALTGETGAGKSMLVDALALALGERADSSAVRAGSERAEITGVFAAEPASAAAKWLSDRDLEVSDECQVRRVVTAEGRSRGYINGQPVPMETLRDLGSQLIEICGQHAHQSLVHRATQREILDTHGGHGALLGDVAAAHEAWVRAEAEKRELAASQRDRQARQDLLAFQVKELRSLDLKAGEFESLERERLLLANVSRIGSGLQTALDRLYDVEELSANDAIGASLREIEALAPLDPRLEPAVAALELSRIQLQEAADEIRRRLGAIEHDPARHDAVELRLAAAVDLARKHRAPPDRLWALARDFEQQLDDITASDSRLESVSSEADRLRESLRTATEALHAARVTAARSLGSEVNANLQSLGMVGCSFEVRVDALPVVQSGPDGADQVEFLISTSPGLAAGPIARIASGGELSRLSLAIQVVAMTANGAPTLIFDEVDAGIGGGVAEIVGQCLQRLSRQRQVLCVTHLPQVASQADHHYAVSKEIDDTKTRTSVREISGASRVDEIARMLGGIKITARTRDHAREMLKSARPRRAG